MAYTTSDDISPVLREAIIAANPYRHIEITGPAVTTAELRARAEGTLLSSPAGDSPQKTPTPGEAAGCALGWAVQTASGTPAAPPLPARRRGVTFVKYRRDYFGPRTSPEDPATEPDSAPPVPPDAPLAE
jgi:hypothetical protein